MIRIPLHATVILLAFFLVSCYPNQGSTIDELDLVVTYHNETTDFTKYNTYVLADTIMYISDNKSDKLDVDAEQAMLEKVDNTFQAYGWTKTDTTVTGNPSDVLILVSILKIENYAVSSGWWGYWGGWYGWGYYPGYPTGGYYPGYPAGGYTQIYPYSTGTIVVEMVNPNTFEDENDSNADPIPLLWLGIIDGLAEGSRQNVKARINEGVDIMFEESPYLKK